MIKYKFEYLLTWLVGFFAKIIPLKVALFFGDLIGDLFFYVIRIRREEAFENLQNCFGNEKSERQLKKILHNNYRHLGRVLLEFARIPLLKRSKILNEIPVHNIHYFEEMKRLNRGIFVLSGHFGNWEYMAAATANLGLPAFCVFKEQKNLAIDNIIRQFRIHVGMQPFKVKGEAAKGILKALAEKGVVIILNDQDAGRRGDMIDFFGRPASTNRGPALIAIKHQVPIVMGFGVREKDGRIRVHLEKFPGIDQFADSEDGVKLFLIEYNRILEKYIRKYPEQWLWMHRRWKTQQVSSDQ